MHFRTSKVYNFVTSRPQTLGYILQLKQAQNDFNGESNPI